MTSFCLLDDYISAKNQDTLMKSTSINKRI